MFNKTSHKLSIAPMMAWTDRHARYFLRLLAPNCVLYTEMITTPALHFGPKDSLLDFDKAEQPLVLQLGGSDEKQLAHCCQLAEKFGYTGINLNVGCPSERVQKGAFGASLMTRPKHVAGCVKAMRQATDIPVSIKTRLGYDDFDSFENALELIDIFATSGCTQFIIHSRKAILSGLSPKQNRFVPKLKRAFVYRIKEARPHFHITINGDIDTPQTAAEQLAHVDGVMIGRAAYKDPYMMAHTDQLIFGAARPLPSREQVALDYLDYMKRHQQNGVPLRAMTRHIFGLYKDCAGARAWRRTLSEDVRSTDDAEKLVMLALNRVSNSHCST